MAKPQRSIPSENHRKDHWAQYGNTFIRRALCPDCDRQAFVLDNKMACCGIAYQADPKFYQIESSAEFRRRIPSAAAQKRILAAQQHRCFYCNRLFGSYAYPRCGPRVKVRMHWDHLVPYSYGANNNTENFVAACHKCNQWKAAIMFQTVEEAQIHLQNRWDEFMDAEFRKGRPALERLLDVADD